MTDYMPIHDLIPNQARIRHALRSMQPMQHPFRHPISLILKTMPYTLLLIRGWSSKLKSSKFSLYEARPQDHGAANAAGAAPAAVPSPEAAGRTLTGRRVRVWWPAESEWFSGEVGARRGGSSKYSVEYDDGDEEVVDFSREKHEFLEAGVQQHDRPMPSFKLTLASRPLPRLHTSSFRCQSRLNPPSSIAVQVQVFKVFSSAHRSRISWVSNLSVGKPVAHRNHMLAPCPAPQPEMTSLERREVSGMWFGTLHMDETVHPVMTIPLHSSDDYASTCITCDMLGMVQ